MPTTIIFAMHQTNIIIYQIDEINDWSLTSSDIADYWEKSWDFIKSQKSIDISKPQK